MRLDDGSVFVVHILWPDGDSYVDEHQPSPGTLRQVERAIERLTSQLVRTLAPGPVGPMRPGTLTFRDEDVEARLTVTDPLLMRTPSYPADVEPGCPARYELTTLDAPPAAARGLVGVCPDGRVVRSPVVSSMPPAVARALESVRDTSDPDPPAAPSSSAVRPCRFVVNDPAPPLRVRASFSSRAEIVGTLDNGTAVLLEERHGRWGRISAPAGWIWTEHLEERCD